MNKVFHFKPSQQGFTLVELVIGIIVLAIALIGMTTMLISQSKDALEPIHRLRASQMGQNILQDILSRSFDQNSDHSGGLYRCDEIWGDSNLWYDSVSKTWQTGGTPVAVGCTDEGDYGIDVLAGEVDGEHQNFNDVDDFIVDEFIDAKTYGNVLGPEGAEEREQIQNYAVKINVTAYNTVFKKISVTIQTPTNEEIIFSALKGNY